MKYLYLVVAGLFFLCAGYFFLQYKYAMGASLSAEGLVNLRFYMIFGVLFVILSRISALQGDIDLLRRGKDSGRRES